MSETGAHMAGERSHGAGRDANVRARRVQLAALCGAVLVTGGMMAFWLWPAPAPEPVSQVPDIDLPRIDGAPVEESWVTIGERQLREHNARLAALEARLATADDRNAELAATNESLRRRLETQDQEAKAVIDAQAAVIRGQQPGSGIGAGTGDPFAGLPASPSAGPSSGASAGADPFAGAGNGAVTPGGTSGGTSVDPLALPAPSLVRFELTPRPPEPETGPDTPAEDIRDTVYWLPAGAHAPAVITTGAAASVSVTGQADPRPVLMRITGRASTAADGRGDVLEADIRGCTIIGEARGDLSSERVYVRLQTMTCRRGRGVVETAVRGFVAGTGQAGVRGTVITREGDLVEKSAWAGVLSGFGQSTSQGLRPPTALFADGSGSRPSDRQVLADAGKAGLAQGIGNAGERLSQYYIQRAEQYQPVVSLKGGTVVEVVFISGTWLDGRGPEGRGPEGGQDAGGERNRGMIPVSVLRGDG